MLYAADIAHAASASEWADRSEFWRELAKADLPIRKLRQRNPAPLILNGHGASMRIENGALVIRDGFTHYPQKQFAYRFFPGDLELPSRILLLDGSGTLSFAVLSWLGEQGVALAVIKSSGEIAIVASGTGFVADRKKVQWQHDTKADMAKRLAFSADLIRRKLLATIPVLKTHFEPSRKRTIALDKTNAGIERLRSRSLATMNDVFAIEGEAASAYFAAWNGLAMNWRGTTRRPIPEQWRSYTGRSSLASGVKPENRRASHPINAMLNYAYAVKAAKLQIQLIADGYDPLMGIMHNSTRGSAALVLDRIEPERPRIDAAILKLVTERQFAASDFVLRKDGVCRLSPQLARMIVTVAP